MQRYVMECRCQHFSFGILWLQITIIERDCTYIFHGSDSVLWTKYLVILFEWELNTNKFFKKANTSRNDSEQFLSIDVVNLTVSEKDLHRNGRGGIFVHDDIVLTGTHVINIR